MTNDIKPKQEVLRALKCHMCDKDLVELIAVISGYNMVSRFLVALDITAEGES
jgi:alkylhydroperoxidase family enzyme